MIIIQMVFYYHNVPLYHDTTRAETYEGYRKTWAPPSKFITNLIRVKPATLTYQEII